MDLANNFNYIFVMVLGYALAAADKHGLKEVNASIIQMPANCQ